MGPRSFAIEAFRIRWVPASVAARLGAAWIDVILVFAILYGIGSLVEASNELTIFRPLLLARSLIANPSWEFFTFVFAEYWGSIILYFVVTYISVSAVAALFTCSNLQGTPGKILFGLCVCSEDENLPLSFERAFSRTLSVLLSILPFGVGFIIMAFNEDRRALHDIINRSLVLRERRHAAARSVFGWVTVLFFFAILAIIINNERLRQL